MQTRLPAVAPAPAGTPVRRVKRISMRTHVPTDVAIKSTGQLVSTLNSATHTHTSNKLSMSRFLPQTLQASVTQCGAGGQQADQSL